VTDPSASSTSLTRYWSWAARVLTAASHTDEALSPSAVSPGLAHPGTPGWAFGRLARYSSRRPPESIFTRSANPTDGMLMSTRRHQPVKDRCPHDRSRPMASLHG
jgi:hypothetical protein